VCRQPTNKTCPYPGYPGKILIQMLYPYMGDGTHRGWV
jgi:hypothetical protein